MPEPVAPILAAEIAAAPDAVRRQAQALAAPLAELVRHCRAHPPRVVVTCARGSSGHAATFAKFVIERHLGIPVAAASPSIASVYRRDLRLDGQLLLAISQSGQSDDLIAQVQSAKRAGALTAALVNAEDCPLARASDIVLPMSAGPELGIAATKSFIASLAAVLRLTALWAEDIGLTSAIERLPERLGQAALLSWHPAFGALAKTCNVVTLGRGPTLAIAREAALKLKEICDLHAEGFSGAEFLHGPVAIISKNYPILMFMPGDAAEDGFDGLAENLRLKGAMVLAVDHNPDAGHLPALTPDRPETDAICQVQSFYAAALQLATLRGIDVEHPRHLQKVTRTR